MQYLGFLEETVLLIVMLMKESAYAFAVSEEYKNHTGKRISISAIHTVLTRLEKKGLINSSMGGATEERGGRRKRLFTPTKEGLKMINEIRESRESLWKQIPALSSQKS